MSARLPSEPWVVRAARLHPGRVAVEAPDATLTYAELERASGRLADELLAESARPGERVAITVAASAAFAIALHACLRTGLVAVPIDLRLPGDQQRERAATCRTVLGPARLDRDLTAGEAMAHAPSPGAPIAGSGEDARTAAVQITTSGTTGPGTPVHLSRGALLWNALGSAAALGQPPHERWLSAMPVSHVGGLTVLMRSAIGATTAVLRPRFDLAEQLALLQGGHATITSVVPTTLSRLLDAGLQHPPNLRLVLLGGAPIPPELLARAAAAGVPVASTYGLSEACSQVLTRGRPLFCTRVSLRAEQESSSEEAPDEVLVQGPTLASGVAGPDGWLATGDRGRRNPDGTIAIVGRIAETIVTGGENVAPTEVEAQLVAHEAVADAAVLGVPDPQWGERIEARIVLAPGMALDEPALQAALRDTLPPFAVPKRITAVDSLPRTPTGKLLRRHLR